MVGPGRPGDCESGGRMRVRLLTVSLVIALAVTIPVVAQAQQAAGNIDLNAFHHAVDSRGFITANASQVLGTKEFSFGLVTNWGHNILNFKTGDNTYDVENVIQPTLQAAG